MKTIVITFMLVASMTSTVHAEEAICPSLGKLAAYAAREREAGRTEEQTYLKVLNQSQIKRTSYSAEWTANTIAWVYEERVGSKDAEKTMLKKCRKAFGEKP